MKAKRGAGVRPASSAPIVRLRRRARERGAIVFITAMTLAVLASLGLFALVTASSEIKTAGAARQNLQSHYLGEAAVVAAAFQLDRYGDGAILPQMHTQTDYNSSQPRNQCWSLATVPGTADVRSRECKIMNYRPPQFDLNNQFTVGATRFDNSNLFDSTLYPTVYSPEIRVEITDPMAGPPLKENMIESGSAVQPPPPRACDVTVTTYGETLPNTGFNGAGLEVARARVVFRSYNKNCQ